MAHLCSKFLNSAVGQLPDMRKSHILMSALWFGLSKPSMLTLLTPFVKEALLLKTEGIDWQDTQGNWHVSKVFVVVSMALIQWLVQCFVI